ncbi:hypothetical protein TNCV_2556331 [Trichonephila clavipes]|nr:hypothetical protein TNCV_2556331 [Trichonephila clavipes]
MMIPQLFMCQWGKLSAQYNSTHLPLITTLTSTPAGGHSSLVVKVSDRGWLVTSSSPVPLKTRCVGERCTFNLTRAQPFSRWCGG